MLIVKKARNNVSMSNRFLIFSQLSCDSFVKCSDFQCLCPASRKEVSTLGLLNGSLPP